MIFGLLAVVNSPTLPGHIQLAGAAADGGDDAVANSVSSTSRLAEQIVSAGYTTVCPVSVGAAMEDAGQSGYTTVEFGHVASEAMGILAKTHASQGIGGGYKMMMITAAMPNISQANANAGSKRELTHPH